MTIFSDAYLPYPYGPVPSPGTPSPKFVDLLNNQTVGGDKTFSGRTSIARPAQVGGAEEHLRFTVSDDAAGFGSIANYTAANGSFVMCERGVSNLATAFAHAWVAQANVDTGALAAGVFQAVDSVSAALTTRPAFAWYNGANLRMQMAASGAMTYTIGAVAGTGETLAQWGVSDSALRLFFENGATSDATLLPVIRGQADTKTLGALNLYGERDALVDTAGGPPVVLVWPRRTGGAALTASNLWGVLHNGAYPLLIGVDGLLRIGQTGGGLAVREGANCKQGVATLTSGTVTVANTSVTANSRIHATGQDNNVTGTVRISTRTPGVSFTLTSTNAADSGVVAYTIFEPS